LCPEIFIITSAGMPLVSPSVIKVRRAVWKEMSCHFS